ncbi:hypothetical protein [uncultured Erythrobacter sp.]|uniref:hypothetical protein n=1 Tax=uncultured Erythrobacter sp. TaxID=263913 RepID=UPI00261BA026|nr:hypothetical protein [uncultured Erythrobacter sp.]
MRLNSRQAEAGCLYFRHPTAIVPFKGKLEIDASRSLDTLIEFPVATDPTPATIHLDTFLRVIDLLLQAYQINGGSEGVNSLIELL